MIPLAFRGGGREFLAVGEIIADEVIATMSQAPELRVVSRFVDRRHSADANSNSTISGPISGRPTYCPGGYRVVGDALIVNVELAVHPQQRSDVGEELSHESRPAARAGQ